MGVPVTGTITTTGSGDTYATTDPLTGIDGWRSVADTTARNAITTLRRREGMAVWVQADGSLWTLNAAPWAGDDTDWTAFSGGGGGTVTTVSVVTANGVSGSVATATTTPAITITLGAITPTSIGSATTATTQSVGDNSTKLATTAFVAAAVAVVSPISTLGDLLYFSTVPARLAGNITTTKMFLSQTGVGASSAAPAWAQPAFTDITGSVAAAQLPNPSSSTLGGVQSAAGVSHQWIASISTSGVPALSQPAFTDISGTAAVAQLPTTGLVINQHSGSILTHSNTNGTVTLELSLNDWIKVGPVTGNFTLATANTTNGQQFTVILSQQNGNSNFSVTWFSGITWVGTSFTAPVMPSTNSAILTATFKTTGTGAYIGWWLGNSAT